MRSISFVAAGAAAAVGTILAAGCGSTSRPTSLPAAASAPSAPALGAPASTSVIPSTTPVPSTPVVGAATTVPLVAAAASSTPSAATAPPTTTSPTTTSTGEQLPVAVESDSQMKANGNGGPTSSILLPTSCRLTGSSATAEGTYTSGKFVPDVYNRYGDIIVLYVFGAPSPGYAQGIQLGASDVSESPLLGSASPWQVSVSVSPSLGAPARCVVAAQPTHDPQLAP